MSFSGEIKEELAHQINASRHCQIAEIAAMIQCCGRIFVGQNGTYSLHIQTENEAVARKYFTLLKKTFNIGTDIISGENEKSGKGIVFSVGSKDPKEALTILQATKYCDLAGTMTEEKQVVPPMIIKSACCRRAFLRGMFLCSGSMSDPEKAYHLEFVCVSEPQAEQVQTILREFEIEAKIVIRKKYFVVYLKEGAAIVDLLNIMEAHVSLMNLENLRIVKEMRNSINRRVNCEAANITKTVNASAKQVEDILLIKNYYGFENLPDNLKEMAEIRLDYPEASLKELGQYLQPPVGKSGVNHRLRKLSELVEEHALRHNEQKVRD